MYAKGLYAWSENEQRWTKAGNVQPLVLAATGGSLAVGHNPGGIYWSEKPKSLEWTKAAGDFESAAPVWELASSDKLVLAGIADGIFRSEDDGRTRFVWITDLLPDELAAPTAKRMEQGTRVVRETQEGRVAAPTSTPRGRAAVPATATDARLAAPQ